MWSNTDFEVEPYGGRGLFIYEPIPSPAPPDARPYCCYLDTVIFYDRGDWARGVVTRLDERRTRWNLFGERWTDADGLGFFAIAPFVAHDGELYELASGEVIRWEGQWYMRWLAWRVRSDDRRLASGLARPELLEVLAR